MTRSFSSVYNTRLTMCVMTCVLGVYSTMNPWNPMQAGIRIKNRLIRACRIERSCTKAFSDMRLMANCSRPKTAPQYINYNIYLHYIHLYLSNICQDTSDRRVKLQSRIHILDKAVHSHTSRYHTHTYRSSMCGLMLRHICGTTATTSSV
jgi:hypothetical protein